MSKVFSHVARYMNFVAGIIIIVLMVATTAEVASRAFAGKSFAGLAEYFEVLLVAFLYLSMAHTQRKGSHVEIDSVVAQLPASWRRWVQAAGTAVLVVALGVFVWFTAGRAWESVAQQEYRMGLTQVPVWPARLVIPIGYAALLLESVLEFVGLVRDRREGDDSTIVGGLST